jgi:hypothetical protein
VRAATGEGVPDSDAEDFTDFWCNSTVAPVTIKGN